MPIDKECVAARIGWRIQIFFLEEKPAARN